MHVFWSMPWWMWQEIMHLAEIRCKACKIRNVVEGFYEAGLGSFPLPCMHLWSRSSLLLLNQQFSLTCLAPNLSFSTFMLQWV